MDNSFSPELPVVLTDNQIFFEDDCACVAAEKNHPVPTVQNHLYKKMEDSYVDFLPHGFRLAFSPYAPQGPSALNTTAWERWQEFNQPQPLIQPVDYQLARQYLVVPADVPPRLQSLIPESLTVWLHVTNACNLDCPYCYVRKSSASMSEATGLDTVEKIFQTAQKRQFKNVKIKYAGGEATLQFRLIQTLSDHAKLLSRQSGLSLQQVILSNGTHIHPENAAWMLDNHVRLMISLDGVGNTHDQMRPYRNGKGSFEAVSHTIDQVLLPAGIIPMLTLTITQQNAAGVADAVRWVLERNLPLSLNFYRHKPGSQTDLEAEENKLIEGMFSAYKVYEEILPSRPFLNGLLDRVQAGAHLHTCGAGSFYLVINHEGALSQCQMMLENPVARTLTNDLLLQVQSGPLHNLDVEQKETCRACIYRYRCAGGCPLETHRASGRWDMPSPNCHIYKALLPATLRLEGLRLLKNYGYVN